PAVLWEFERQTIVWGREVEGLELGLSASPISPRLGDIVTFRIHVANATARAIEFEAANLDYHYQFNRPVILDGDGQRARLAMNLVAGVAPPLRWTKRTVAASGIAEVGSTSWRLRHPTWVLSRAPSVSVVPGTYTVKFASFQLKGRPASDTGTVTLE